MTAADGVDIACSRKGGGSTTVLFVHGWSCDRTYWDGQFDDAAKKYGAVRMDLPGHGASGSQRIDWSVATFGVDIRSVIEQLNLNRVIVVGHSLGGPVAVEAALLLPQRIIGIIGVDALHDADFKWDERQWEALMKSYEQDFDGTCDRFVRTMFVPTSEPKLVDRVAADMCRTDPVIALAMLRAFRDYDAAASMAKIRVPIRCINAPSFPTNVEGNRRYADFDVRILPGVGHFLMLEKPLEFNQLLLEVIAEIAT